MLLSPRYQEKLLETLTDAVYVLDREGRITFWNRAAEELTGFTREEVLGRHCREGVLCHLDESGLPRCGPDCPTDRTIEDGQEREEILSARHADGHRIPVLLRTAPFRDEHGHIMGGVGVMHEHRAGSAVDRQLRDLAGQAYADPLTGLPNRRGAVPALHSRLEELRRYGWGFGALFVDLDHFKLVNDRFSHAVGDRLLRAVAGALDRSLRVFDLAARWGGEEFLGIAVNVDGSRLRDVAERFRETAARTSVDLDGQAVSCTVSIGATLARVGDSVETLVARADSLMYRSKALGRNRVTVDEEEVLVR
jgi:diguanylate cyclase (GGDEF)-like protein/PAS domain S-box-containing protein